MNLNKTGNGMIARTNEHIQKWLGVNRLVDDIDDKKLLVGCIKQIASAFGGHKQLLYFLSRFSDISQLETMHNAIKENKANYIKSKSNTPTKEPNTFDLNTELREMSIDIDLTSCSKHYFTFLANESISNICDYLSQKDVESFKLTSKQIGIVCLQQQTKIALFVFNTNKLKNDCTLNLRAIAYDKKTRSRYYATRRFYSLFEEWSEAFNIPEQYLLVFHHPRALNITFLNANRIRLQPINTFTQRQFIVVDARKMVILDSANPATRMNIDNHTIESIKDHKLLILEYFDIMRQKTNIVQFIMYKVGTTIDTLLQYIQHQFIYIDSMQTVGNKWYDAFMDDLKQIEFDTFTPNLLIFDLYHISYRMTDITVAYCRLLKNSFYTFQINPDHQWFHQTRALDAAQENMDGFYENVSLFYNRTVHAYVRYTGCRVKLETIVSRIQSLHNLYIYSNVLNVATDPITFIDKLTSGISLKTNKRSWSATLRMRISEELLRGIVDCTNIELFTCNSLRRIPWNAPLLNYDPYNINFQIVNYNTSQIQDNERIYQIKIHQQEQAPYPIHKPAERVTIKYKKEFIVKDFINHVLGSRDTANANECKINDSISYILSRYALGQRRRRANIQIETAAYLMETAAIPRLSRHENIKIILFDLFMIETKRSDQASGNKLKLKIKFMIKSSIYFPENQGFNAKTNVAEIDNFKYVGMPLIIWVGKKDSLQDIIDEYVHREARESVQFSYRVKLNDKIVSIAKGQRNKCFPYRFLQQNPNDFIIVSLAKIQETQFWIPSFPNWVYNL